MKALIFISIVILLGDTTFGQTIGCKMASVSDGKYHSENEAIVKQYNNIFNQLAAKYIESKERIADMTTVAKDKLAESGQSEPLINIMTGINLLSDKYTTNKKYADNIVLYISLREQGRSHENTLQNIQKLLNVGSMDEIMKQLGLR
jgi:cell division protein ZapA (FtsZ GTPase activity inhibitor)